MPYRSDHSLTFQTEKKIFNEVKMWDNLLEISSSLGYTFRLCFIQKYSFSGGLYRYIWKGGKIAFSPRKQKKIDEVRAEKFFGGTYKGLGSSAKWENNAFES